jgi:hypothetical protein
MSELLVKYVYMYTLQIKSKNKTLYVNIHMQFLSIWNWRHYQERKMVRRNVAEKNETLHAHYDFSVVYSIKDQS